MGIPVRRQWKVQLAAAGMGVTLATLVGCPGSPDWPPFVRSGPSGGNEVSGSSVITDGGVPDSALPDGGVENISCTYAIAGATVQQCAVVVDDPDPSDDIQTCATSAAQGGLAGTDSNDCQPEGIVGCCEFTPASPSLSTPSYICYYTGTTFSSGMCTAGGGTWSTAIP